MPFDGSTHTAPLPSQITLRGAEARGFIRIMAYGQELEAAKAGVRSALRVLRNAQALARDGFVRRTALSPAAAREIVRDRIVRARSVQAKIEGRV